MELIHRTIPREFLDVLPEGMKFIHRHGKEFLVVEELLCPNGHSLMVESVRIHGEPSIRIAIERPEGTGLIFIDSFWGSHAKLFTFLADPTRPMAYAEAHCPHCGVSLVVDRRCGRFDCDSSRSLRFILPGAGNTIYVCAKLGCPDHAIIVSNISESIAEKVNQINYFGYGEDDEAFGAI